MIINFLKSHRGRGHLRRRSSISRRKFHFERVLNNFIKTGREKSLSAQYRYASGNRMSDKGII